MGLKKQSPVLALVTRPPEFILLLIVSLHKGRGDFYGWDPITRCPRKWAGLIFHISDCDLLLLENGRDRDWIWRRTRDPRDRRRGWEVGQGVSRFPDCKFTFNTINSHSRFPHRIVPVSSILPRNCPQTNFVSNYWLVWNWLGISIVSIGYYFAERPFIFPENSFLWNRRKSLFFCFLFSPSIALNRLKRGNLLALCKTNSRKTKFSFPFVQTEAIYMFTC